MKAQPGVWYTICTDRGKVPVKITDIIMLKGNGSCVSFYIRDEAETLGYRIRAVGKHLKCFEDVIHPDLVRINQRHIVNLNFVNVLKGNRVLMRLPLNYMADVTRTYRKAVYDILGLRRAA